MKTLSSCDLEWLWEESAFAIRIGRPLQVVLREYADADGETRRGRAAARLAGALSRGRTLSQAVADEGRLFPPGMAQTIEAAERGDRIAETLQSLADNARAESAMRDNIIYTVSYPLVVAFAGVLLMGVLDIKILPTVQQYWMTMYADLDLMLPPLTQFMLGNRLIGPALQAESLLLILLPALALIVLYVIPESLFRLPEWVLRYRLKTPVLGQMVQRNLLARWSASMGLLVEAGVPEAKAVRLAGESTGNATARLWSESVAVDLERGMALGLAMEQTPFFPPVLVWMVQASARAGGHRRVWPVARDLFLAQAERLGRFSSIFLRGLFVALILQMVGIVLLMVFSLFMPLINLMTSMGM